MGNILKIKNGNEWQSIPAIVGPQGQTGATGPGVASGGTAGQVQKKKSNTDYDTEWGSVSNLPTGGTAGQFLKKTANGEEWADVNQVPSQTGSRGMYLYVDNSGNIVWQYNNIQLSINEDSVTNNPVFTIVDMNDVMNAYRNGQRIIVDYRYANGDEDDNPYVMSGINAIKTNDVYTYLTQIQRLNSDGTWDIKQYLFSFDDSNSRWEGIEQTIPSTPSIPEASGVSF